MDTEHATATTPSGAPPGQDDPENSTARARTGKPSARPASSEAARRLLSVAEELETTGGRAGDHTSEADLSRLLRGIAPAEAALDRAALMALGAARGRGWSWPRIGTALGMTADGARDRFDRAAARHRDYRAPLAPTLAAHIAHAGDLIDAITDPPRGFTRHAAARLLGAVLLAATLERTPELVGHWLTDPALSGAAEAAARHPKAAKAHKALVDFARERPGTRADQLDIIREAVRSTPWALGSAESASAAGDGRLAVAAGPTAPLAVDTDPDQDGDAPAPQSTRLLLEAPEAPQDRAPRADAAQAGPDEDPGPAADLASLDMLITDYVPDEDGDPVARALGALSETLGWAAADPLDEAMEEVAALDAQARTRALGPAGERIWQRLHRLWCDQGPTALVRALDEDAPAVPAPGGAEAAVAAAGWAPEAAAHVSAIVNAVRPLCYLPPYRSGPARALVAAADAADGPGLARAVTELRAFPARLREPLLGGTGEQALKALPGTDPAPTAGHGPDRRVDAGDGLVAAVAALRDLGQDQPAELPDGGGLAALEALPHTPPATTQAPAQDSGAGPVPEPPAAAPRRTGYAPVLERAGLDRQAADALAGPLTEFVAAASLAAHREARDQTRQVMEALEPTLLSQHPARVRTLLHLLPRLDLYGLPEWTPLVLAITVHAPALERPPLASEVLRAAGLPLHLSADLDALVRGGRRALVASWAPTAPAWEPGPALEKLTAAVEGGTADQLADALDAVAALEKVQIREDLSMGARQHDDRWQDLAHGWRRERSAAGAQERAEPAPGPGRAEAPREVGETGAADQGALPDDAAALAAIPGGTAVLSGALERGGDVAGQPADTATLRALRQAELMDTRGRITDRGRAALSGLSPEQAPGGAEDGLATLDQPPGGSAPDPAAGDGSGTATADGRWLVRRDDNNPHFRWVWICQETITIGLNSRPCSVRGPATTEDEADAAAAAHAAQQHKSTNGATAAAPADHAEDWGAKAAAVIPENPALAAALARLIDALGGGSGVQRLSGLAKDQRPYLALYRLVRIVDSGNRARISDALEDVLRLKPTRAPLGKRHPVGAEALRALIHTYDNQ
ncbi:hypothetical protein ABZ234_08330 [Nocardiopsis sp. NPDC006198]|uniref:hypothetical protein n=1 Tax=Nocardiopsis sp. NPDC006198 TaxID=3154472 RepID=UPI0033A158C5